ncbi:TIM barrel protein [Candidatus Woesearchaeota archaeon]|nr:TIM barrel protein [Candidatus Woesearchaeota archaeon]
MEVGIKLWSSNPVKYVDKSEFADFIEVLPRSERSLDKLARRKRKYTIHVPHELFGFSPIHNMRKSRKLLDQAVGAAKKLKAGLIIMHTGLVEEEPDEEFVRKAAKAVAKLAKTVSYGRLLIENSYPKAAFDIEKGKYYICYDYEHLRELLEITGAGFCLDFEHAAIAAHQLGIDYKRFVAGLMRLKPEYFQLSGVRLNTRVYSKGHHQSIFEGAIDPDFVKETVKKANKPVCLETPVDIEQRKKEVEFLKNGNG